MREAAGKVTTRRGGLVALYGDDLMFELRGIFAADNQRAFADFKHALDKGDRRAAHRIAHTLKSSAGTIEKLSLQEAAREVEDALREPTGRVPQELVDALERELKNALDELAPFLKKDAETQTEYQRAGLPQDKEFLDALELQLRKGCPDCLEHADALRLVAGCEELVKQMTNYDFDDALQTFSQLRKKGE